MKRIILALALVFSVGVVSLQPAYADCKSASKQQVLEGSGTSAAACDDNGVTNILRTAVNILGVVAGIAAVIMIIISGFRYITSGGDSGKVSAAKNALIYALVGLVIVALSQFLVHFVLKSAGDATCPAGTHLSKAGSSCVKN